MTFLDLLIDNSFGPYHKKGTRYVGPCPFCGGSDTTNRFVTKPGSDRGKCFSCNWGGNTVKLLRELEGIGCKEAHDRLGLDCDNAGCPYYEKCKKISPKRADHSASVSVPFLRKETFTPAAPRTPADLWQEAAGKLVSESHERLLADDEALAYLAKRGLDLESIKKYRLGWLAGERGKSCIFRRRSSWGLPDVVDEKSGKVTVTLWIPRGIVIPTFTDGHIDRIRIRRPNEDLNEDKDAKYIAIEGGGNSLVSLNPAAKAQMPVESDLDALLVDSIAGDLVGAIPLTTCTVRPDSNISALLETAVIILVALDADPLVSDLKTRRVKSGGPVNALWWRKRYPKSERLPPPIGKDPGEAYQEGVDLRAWILDALPISLHPRQIPVKKENKTEVAEVTTIEKMHQMLNDALSRIQSGWQGEAWAWLEEQKPDVVSFIRDKENATDAFFAAEDEPGLVKHLEVLERAYQKAWKLYAERPPVIERQVALLETVLPLAER